MTINLFTAAVLFFIATPPMLACSRIIYETADAGDTPLISVGG